MENIGLGDFFQFAKYMKVQGSQVGAVRWVGWGGVQNWLREQDVVSFHRQGLENLILCYDKCLNNLETVEKQRAEVQRYRVLFLVPLTSIYVKKIRNLTF
jgi:hypothetical protein